VKEKVAAAEELAAAAPLVVGSIYYVGVEEEEQEHSWCPSQKGDDFLGRRRRRFGVEGNKDHRDERQPELKEEKEYHCLEKSFLFSSFLFSSPCFHEVR